MQIYKPKKIIFVGSRTLLLKKLAEKDETEVVSSASFLSSLSVRFRPDLVVFDEANSASVRDARRLENLEFTPFLVLSDSFSYVSEREIPYDIPFLFFCNEDLCTSAEFLGRLSQLMENKQPLLPAKTGLLVKKAVVCMNSKMGEKISREDVASFCGCDCDYLTRIFVREMGVPLWTYLSELRLFNARRMLSFTTVSLKEVSSKCGFRDTAYFSNCFKKKFGVTPGSLRKSF